MYKQSVAIASAALLSASMAFTTALADTPIKLQQTVGASALGAPPNRLTISLFESREGKDPVAIQTYFPGEWTTNVDLSGGLPQSDTAIQFSMQFDQIDQRKPGETLWVETRMDGSIIGDRFAISAPTSAAFRVENDGGVLFQGTQGNGAIPIEGGGTRMMWYSAKAAFRAGHVDDSQWNDETAITGTVTTTAASRGVTGNGTAFLAELKIGDRIRIQ